MKLDTQRSGFVLPVALLLVVVVTGGVFATFGQVSAERRVRATAESGSLAYSFAETGLELIVTRWRQLGVNAPAVEKDSVAFEIPGRPGDSAHVVLQRIRPKIDANTPALYAIRSTGVWKRPDWPGAPEVRRTVTRLSEWVDGTMKITAGWQSLSGLRKNGNSGELSGIDACGVEDPVAGVAVPKNPGYSGHTNPTIGSPPILHTGDTPQEAAASVGIDWDAIINQGALNFDVVIPGSGWPTNFDDWPIIFIDNRFGSPFSLPTSGRGMLIVSGDLTIGGNINWDGVILVGGTLTSNGINRVEGATITGLNVQLGEHVDMSDVGNGVKYYRYHSCNVAEAMKSLSGFNVYENTWTDVWATY